jgi:hypothetical protein
VKTIRTARAENRDKRLLPTLFMAAVSCPRRKLSKFIDQRRQDSDHAVDIFVTVISAD